MMEEYWVEKTHSGVALTEDSKWFKIINPISTDTNKVLDSADASFGMQQNKEGNSWEQQ